MKNNSVNQLIIELIKNEILNKKDIVRKNL